MTKSGGQMVADMAKIFVPATAPLALTSAQDHPALVVAGVEHDHCCWLLAARTLLAYALPCPHLPLRAFGPPYLRAPLLTDLILNTLTAFSTHHCLNSSGVALGIGLSMMTFSTGPEPGPNTYDKTVEKQSMASLVTTSPGNRLVIYVALGYYTAYCKLSTFSRPSFTLGHTCPFSPLSACVGLDGFRVVWPMRAGVEHPESILESRWSQVEAHARGTAEAISCP
eukprot:gene7244-1294_t